MHEPEFLEKYVRHTRSTTSSAKLRIDECPHAGLSGPQVQAREMVRPCPLPPSGLSERQNSARLREGCGSCRDRWFEFVLIVEKVCVVCIATMMGSKAMVDISCLCLAAVLIAMLAIVAWNPPYVNSGTGKSAWTGADILQEVMLAIQLMALSIGILQRELPAKYEKTVELALLAFLVVPITAAFVWSYVDYAARVDIAKASDNRAIARQAKQPRSVQIRSVKAESGTPVYAKTCSQCLVTSSLVGFVASIVIFSGLSGETVLELAMPVSQGGPAVQMEMVCPDGPVSTRASPDDCQTTQTSDDGLCVDPEDPYFCSAGF